MSAKWRDFEHDGKTYDLAHLHPCTVRFERQADKDKPAEVYNVDIIFTSHCFTRAPLDGEAYDPRLVYPHDAYERRLFDVRRHELSKRLPEIIQGLPARKPRQNNKRQSFFTVEIITESGTTCEYDVFFKVEKIGRGQLRMIVETAFIRDPGYKSSRPTGKPVSFWIILYNTMRNIPIRP
jgi:hypothetical protein